MKLVRYLFVGVTGALVGMLFAPKPGREMRRELEERFGPQLESLGVTPSLSRPSLPGQSSTEALRAKIEETRRRLREQLDEEQS